MGHTSAADSCNKGSFDDKVDADTFWWAVIMDCSEIEHELAVNTYLQKFDWSIWQWRDITFMIYGQSQLHNDWLSASRYRDVTPGGGLNCYRIRTVHLVVDESPHGVEYFSETTSPGKCF